MAPIKKEKKLINRASVEKPKAKKKPVDVDASKKSPAKKVSVEHPRGKEGVNITPEKYDLIRQNILSCIWRNEEIAYAQLLKELETKLASSFEGPASTYINIVLGDLQNKDIIEQVPDKKPQHLRLKQKLEQPED